MMRALMSVLDRSMTRSMSVTRGVGILLFCLSFTLVLDLSSGQSPAESCKCEGVPCEKNMTAADCPTGRVIARQDCRCCFVCAKQLTEPCNARELPCDKDFGLVCGDDNKCKAGTACSDDTSCSSDSFCVGGACADPCRVSPDVCRGGSLKNGVCVVRNHRAVCSCPEDLSLDSVENACVEKPKVTHCTQDERKIEVGGNYYLEKCSKKCTCEAGGEMSCKATDVEPECSKGFIPMSKITIEMSQLCKVLIANDELFDGCCVPQKCQNATTQEDSKGSRGFKLTESQNNLEDDDDKPKPREMLMSEDDHPVSTSEEETTNMPMKSNAPASTTDTSEDDKSSSSTSESSTSVETSMEVTVLRRTAHSAVVELPKNTQEAELSIALSSQLIKTPGSADVWKVHRIPPGLPHITLSDLQPNTSYTLKYSFGAKEFPTVQFVTEDDRTDDEHEPMKLEMDTVTEIVSSASMEEDENDSSGVTTERSSMEVEETLPITEMNNNSNSSNNNSNNNSSKSNNGILESNLNDSPRTCLFNGTSYDVGHVIMDGCDQRCECMKNGQMKCLERCSIPFFKKGHFAHDPLCFEEPSGVDECCVLAACARSNNNNGAGEARVLKHNPCESAKCGPNSDCRYEVSPSGMQENQETLCVCKEGYVGDPYDEKMGCISGTSTTSAPAAAEATKSTATPAVTPKLEGCVFNNVSYEYGAQHLDGCSYKCHCETSGEFLCRPRCNFQRDEFKEIPAGCEIKKDPSDAECCEMLVCHGEPLESGSRKETPEIPNDGCFYKNQTYAKDMKFFDGCEQQCMCLGKGDVSCKARCPPAGPKVNEDCITLPDPIDKCCTVTVCDPQEKLAISDVMKAANESAAAAAAATTMVPILRPKARLDDISSTMSPSSSQEPVTIMPRSESDDTQSGSSEDMNESGKPSAVLDTLLPTEVRITTVTPLNETSVMVTITLPEQFLQKMDDETLKIYYSIDMKDWSELEARIKDLYIEGMHEIHTVINGLQLGKEYFFKAKVNETETNVLSGFTRMRTGSSEEFETGSQEMTSGEVDNSGQTSSTSMEDTMCQYKGKRFHFEEEFYDGCAAYCTCGEHGLIECQPIECPTDLGLELLNPNCLRWASSVPRLPPNCCPEMICVQNSTCEVGGMVFNNYQDIPQKITGCDKRCYCMNGNVTCEKCPPISDQPPEHCPPEFAVKVPIPPTECCMTWDCHVPNNHHNISAAIIDGSHSMAEHMLNQTLTHSTNMTLLPHNGSLVPNHADDDQFIPPSTGNQPSFAPLNTINREQLEELLHQLSALTGDRGQQQHHHQPPPGDVRPDVPRGTYIAVRDVDEVHELERSGAKVIEQAEDGSFIVFIPSETSLLHGQNPNPLYPHPEVIPAGHSGAPNFPIRHPFENHGHGGHGGHGLTDRLGNVMVRALNESTLQIDFTVPPVLVGLHGVVEVLYTTEFSIKPNPDQWERQVFQQAEDLIDNSHLQLFLAGLEPDSDYHIKIQVIMRDIQNAPASNILLVRTPPKALPTTTLPPEIVIDPEMKLVDVTSSTIKINWRKITDFEASLIDGVQIKYRAELDQVYSTTPLIHRSITTYELTNLQPNTSYEVDLLFIPFTTQSTELRSAKPIHINTLKEDDLYDFNIAVETGKITESSAELIIGGVPYPEDKFVHIYQVIYQSDVQKEQKAAFKVAKRESNKKAIISDLKPGTRYRVWVEAILTNGKKKHTNVIDVLTKAGQLPTPDRASQEKPLEDARSKESIPEGGSYTGALVALAIIAALSIVGIIVLLMILIRKQNQAKAPINDRKSESSYDNPSFKNYDIESNGHSKPGDP